MLMWFTPLLGFTVALALVAQNLFLVPYSITLKQLHALAKRSQPLIQPLMLPQVEVIPVIRVDSFLEFIFLFSFGLSLLATVASLYQYKLTEGREENDRWVGSPREGLGSDAELS